MVKLIQTLISGLSLGSIYALIALGYTMVYGIAKMLNFAHGDIIMVGAYAVITSVLTLNLPPVVAILISILVCVVLGITIEFLAYRPLRQAPPLSVLITAIGVSYLLQNLALLIFGSEQKATPTMFQFPTLEFGGVYIDGITLLTLIVTAVIMIALTLFIAKTRMGKSSWASASTVPSPSPSPSAPPWPPWLPCSTACPTFISAPPPVPCPASRPLPPLSSAASAPSPALCWAAS